MGRRGLKLHLCLLVIKTDRCQLSIQQDTVLMSLLCEIKIESALSLSGMACLTASGPVAQPG